MAKLNLNKIKPNWWDKPITWGASVKMSLVSLLVSGIIVVIEYGSLGLIDLDSLKPRCKTKKQVAVEYEKTRTNSYVPNYEDLFKQVKSEL